MLKEKIARKQKEQSAVAGKRSSENLIKRLKNLKLMKMKKVLRRPIQTKSKKNPKYLKESRKNQNH